MQYRDWILPTDVRLRKGVSRYDKDDAAVAEVWNLDVADVPEVWRAIVKFSCESLLDSKLLLSFDRLGRRVLHEINQLVSLSDLCYIY